MIKELINIEFKRMFDEYDEHINSNNSYFKNIEIIINLNLNLNYGKYLFVQIS
jgi:hypothetical protein